MWNWKPVFEDEVCLFFCDLDKIVDTESDEDELYASMDCYQPLPERFGVWTSLSLKDKALKKLYLRTRKRMGLRVEGYENYQYSLCLVEFDAPDKKYRIIPAMDYDREDEQIGDSFILGDGDSPFIEGLSGDWAKITPKKTHPMIKELWKRLSVNA